VLLCGNSIAVSEEVLLQGDSVTVSEEVLLCGDSVAVSEEVLLQGESVTVSEGVLLCGNSIAVSEEVLLQGDSVTVSEEVLLCGNSVAVSEEVLLQGESVTVSEEVLLCGNSVAVSEEVLLQGDSVTVSEEVLLCGDSVAVSEEVLLQGNSVTVSEEVLLCGDSVAVSKEVRLGGDSVAVSEEVLLHGDCVVTCEGISQTNRGVLSTNDQKRIARVRGVICGCYNSGRINAINMNLLIEDAYRTTDLIFGKRDAVAAGAGFKWPTGITDRDLARAVSCGYSLEAMALERQGASGADRLSVARIENIVSKDDPDRAVLLTLVTGMKVLVSDTFVPNNTPPKMRQLYKEVSGAVNRGLLKLHEAELVFILPRSAMYLFGTMHYSPVHWTTKVGKEAGRALFDSKDDSFGPALNSDAARDMLRALYGAIEHPTIDDIAVMIVDYIEECKQLLGDAFRMEDLIVWKGDLRGAFTLLSFSADGVKYLACELTDDLILVYHTGLFGWTGTPFAFDVVTRVLRREINKRIHGRMTMYVDDLIGITLLQHLAADKASARLVCEGLLGSKAMAEDKWEEGRRIDAIGWSIDLDLMRVSIARRNFLKILYGFFSVDENKQVQVCTIETLASWAARYKAVLRQAKPLTAALYAEIHNMTNRHAYKPLSQLGRQAINIWRMLLCLLHFEPTAFARNICSFKVSVATYCIEYDASLEGLGVGVSAIQGTSLHSIGVGGSTFPFDLVHDSKYQNTVEFTAVVVGMACLARSGIKDCTVRLVGDSRTSLKWGLTERFKGTLCLAASLVYILLSSHFNLWVSESDHVPAADNWFYDKISRGVSPTELGVAPALILHLQSDADIQQLLQLCDPTVDNTQTSAVLDLWRRILQWIEISIPSPLNK
jgi:hypothetical protein